MKDSLFEIVFGCILGAILLCTVGFMFFSVVVMGEG